jgi:sugar phosphate isomerase/epimerase
MKEYNLTIQERNSYLYAHVSGKDSMEAALVYWQEIIDTCKRLKYSKILVEEDLQGSPETVDYFEFGEFLAKIAGGWQIKIAFVDHHEDHAQDNHFAENVSFNRGVNVKVCMSIKDAEDWLFSQNEKNGITR